MQSVCRDFRVMKFKEEIKLTQDDSLLIDFIEEDQKAKLKLQILAIGCQRSQETEGNDCGEY